tara:strand:+ start:356 stop:511 length:156 start_codon:yes stop_codon:yes gene_type:complete
MLSPRQRSRFWISLMQELKNGRRDDDQAVKYVRCHFADGINVSNAEDAHHD